MEISHSAKLWGAFLSFTLFVGMSSDFNPMVASTEQTVLSYAKKSLAKFSEKMTEKAWGNVGAIAYHAGDRLMLKNNAKSQGLDEMQKEYLRPHFGDLVDRVMVVYSAVLMEDWVAASFKINVGRSNAQVYGHRVYIRDIYRPGDLQQIVLLAHELYHCKQYEQLGSLSKFGYHYFFQYKKAEQKYEKNIFEQEAFKFEKFFANWLANEVRVNGTRSRNRRARKNSGMSLEPENESFDQQK
jgi:hypothetical protein